MQKIMSAQPSMPGVTLILELVSVPAERTSWLFVPLKIFSAVKLLRLFWLHKNRILILVTNTFLLIKYLIFYNRKN